MQLSLADPRWLARRVEDRIARFAERAPRILVAWSGGKDSTAALLAAYSCCRHKLYAAYIHIVGQTHADNARAVLEAAKKLAMSIARVEVCGPRFIQPLRLPQPPALIYVLSSGRFCQGFWHEAMKRGWPAPVEHAGRPGKRWCCHVFKTEPLNALSRLGFRWHVVGVKAADSRYRAKQLASLDPELPMKQFNSHMTLYPIIDLSNEDVWSILRYYNRDIYEVIKKQYTKWGYSPNCTICPLQSKKNFERTVQLMPTTWLQHVRKKLLLMQKHTCTTKKWSCRDIARKLETIEKELEIEED